MISQEQIRQTKRNPVISQINESSVVWSERSYPKITSSVSNSSSEQTVKNVRSTVNNNEKNENKRTKIIFVSIIIGFSLVVITLIVTLTIFLRSTNTTSATQPFRTTGNINLHISTTAGTTNTPIIYDVGNGGISNDPPCLSHTVINDPLRNVNTSGIGGTCDNGPPFNTSIGGRWIRFIGTGGTMIPLSSPGVNHCGAFLAAWFNGSLPSTIGTISPGDICVETYTVIICKLGLNASIVNCGHFYVYFLPPQIMCNTRYCTI